jgi:hypothetical protein
MVQRVSTVAFEGIEARAVDVQVQVALGADRLGGGAFGAPNYRQSRPRRSAEGRQPFTTCRSRST